MRQFSSLWLCLYLCFQIGNAQETSNKKHVVVSNETLVDIAQLYNVTVEDIQKLNPNIIGKINENDILFIPTPPKNTASKKQSFRL